MLSELPKIIASFSKTERYVVAGAVVVLLVSSFFWGVNLFYNLTVEAPARGGTYTEGIIGQPTSINPLIAGSNNIDRDILEMTFADLPELTESIKVSDDHKTWTITLKPRLLWSDGKPLTTADILFTLETIQNLDTQSPHFSTWQGVVGERLSEREMRLSLRNPYAFFEDNLKNFKIAPRHIFGNIPPSNLRLSSYNLEPIGSGPYKFVKYEKRKDGFITKYYLEINENYGGEPPFIENFNFAFFANEDEALESFNKKEIDGLGGLDPKKLKNLKVGYRVFSINMPRYYAIFLNQSTHPALKEKAVRDALDNSIDRNSIIKSIFDNHAMSVDGPIPSITEGYSPMLSGTLDLETVRLSLEDAGWEFQEAEEQKAEENDKENGKKETGEKVEARAKTISKNKIKLEFDILVPQTEFLIDAVNIIKNDWAKIGVRLNPAVLTLADINEAIKTRNYSMIIFGNTLRGNPDTFSFWHSSERFYPGLNLSIYNNKKADALSEGIRKDFDFESRKSSLVKLQEIIREDRPAIFLFSPNYIYATPKNLSGFHPKLIVTSSDRFDNINEWHLRKTRVFK